MKSVPLFGYLLLVLCLVACGNEKRPDTTPTRGTDFIVNGAKQATFVPTLDTNDQATTMYTQVAEESVGNHERQPTELQVGVNFVRFFFTEHESELPRSEGSSRYEHTEPGSIFEDFDALGVHAFRQFVKADLFWERIEPNDDEWSFSMADKILIGGQFEPIVTLFSLQYASPTPPWVQKNEEFRKTLGIEAQNYLQTLIDRYGEYIKYWELGNEMGHWAAADELRPGTKPPPHLPDGGFTPQEQGIFLKQVSKFIKARDPDAVIVLPGMGGINEHTLDFWLSNVIAGAGGHDWFDIVNYHHYGSWQNYLRQRPMFDTTRHELGIEGKPVWLTETGSTSSETLTKRTNYPNSEKSQSADVFRRLIQAFGHGDDLVLWHTYIGSTGDDNDWRDYGMRDPGGGFKPSYYAYRLFLEELIPHNEVELLSSSAAGINSYKVFTESGVQKYVIWGSGVFKIPENVEQMVSVFSEDGMYRWLHVKGGSSIDLSEIPVLLK